MTAYWRSQHAGDTAIRTVCSLHSLSKKWRQLCYTPRRKRLTTQVYNIGFHNTNERSFGASKYSKTTAYWAWIDYRLRSNNFLYIINGILECQRESLRALSFAILHLCHGCQTVLFVIVSSPPHHHNYTHFKANEPPSPHPLMHLHPSWLLSQLITHWPIRCFNDIWDILWSFVTHFPLLTASRPLERLCIQFLSVTAILSSVESEFKYSCMHF